MFGSIKLGSSTVLLNRDYTPETHGVLVKIPKVRRYSSPIKSESLMWHADINF